MPSYRKLIVRLIIKANIICFVFNATSCDAVLLAKTQRQETKKVDTQPDSSRLARELWERAITAKGGRERLHAVHNVVVSARSIGGTVPVYQESLYVLPNKIWSWTDYRPSIFGLRMEMYNYETGMKYVVQQGDPRTELEPIEAKELARYKTSGYSSDLMETRWVSPLLIATTTGKVRGQAVNIIQTTVNGERLDFALDRKTHLPIKTSFYSVERGKTYVTNTYLSNYVEIEGIKVASIIELDEGTKYKQSYRFNVQFDESIFHKAPSLEKGPSAWKMAGR